MNSSGLFTVTGLNNVDKPQVQLDSVSQASPFLFSLLQQSSLSQKSGDKSSSLSRRSNYENIAIKRDDTLEISSNSDIIGQRKHNREHSYSKKETDNAVTRMLNKKENELKNQVQILVSCINKAQEQCLQLEKQADNIRFTEETNSKSYLKQNEKRTIKLAELNQQIEFAANKLKFEMILQEQLQQQATLLSENEKLHEIIENNCLDQNNKENTSYLNKTQQENEHNNDNQLSSISVNTSKSNLDRLKDLMKRSQINVQNLKQIIAGFQMQQQDISANSMEEADIYQSAQTNLQQTLKNLSSQLKASNSSRTQLETALVTLLQAHQLNENIVFKAFNIDYESKLQLQKDNFSLEYLECCNSSVISTIRDINSNNFSTLKNYENQQKQKSSEKSSSQQINPKYGRITIDIKSLSNVEPSVSIQGSQIYSKQQNNESFYTEKNNNNFDKENIPFQPNIQVKNSSHQTHTLNSKPVQSDTDVSFTQPPSNFIFEKLKQTPNNKSFSSVNAHHKNNTNSMTFSSQSNAKYNSNSLSCINQPESSLNCSNTNNNISHVSFFSPSQEKFSKLFFSPSKKDFSSTITLHHKKQPSNSSLLRINRIAAGTNGNLRSAEKFGNSKADNNLNSKDFSFVWRNKGIRRSRSSSNLQNQNRKRPGSTEQSLNQGTDKRESQQPQANLKIQNLGNNINYLPIKNNASLNRLQMSGQNNNNNPLSCHISSCSRRVHSTYSSSSQTSSSFQKLQTLNERFTCNTFREYQNEEFVPQVFKQTSHFKQENHQEQEDTNLKVIEGQDYNQKHTFTLNSQQNRPIINSSAYQKDHYYPENNQNSFQLNPLSVNNHYVPHHQPMLQPVLISFKPPKNAYLHNSNSANVSSNQIDTSGLNLFTNRENSNSIIRLNKTRQKQLNNQKLFDQFPDTSNTNSRCFEIYKMLGSARENITKKQAYDPRLHLGKPTSFGYTKRIIKFNQMNNMLEFIREENSFNSSKRTVEQAFQKQLVKEITLPSITESILNLKQRYSNQSVDMENQGIPQRLIDQKYLPFSIEIFRFGKIECVASSEGDLKGILEATDNLCQNGN